MWLDVTFLSMKISSKILLFSFLQNILENGDSSITNHYRPSVTPKQLVNLVYYTNISY